MQGKPQPRVSLLTIPHRGLKPNKNQTTKALVPIDLIEPAINDNPPT